MDLLPLVLTSGWGSGINAYGVLVVMGLFGRYADASVVPDALQRPGILVLAGAMFAIEFVADKIPYLDSVWDSVSTIVRPVVGTAIGYLLAGDSTSVDDALTTAAYAALGGATALATHGVKAGLRLAINTSPEPVSNIVVSLSEDAAVVTVVALALYHPWLALAIATVLFVTGLLIVVLLFRVVRRGWQRQQARRAAARG